MANKKSAKRSRSKQYEAHKFARSVEDLAETTPGNNSNRSFEEKLNQSKPPADSRPPPGGLGIRDTPVNSEHAQFVEAYIQCQSVKGASVLMGIPYERAKNFKRLPRVKELLAERYKELQERTHYTQAQALAEAEDARQFAKQRGNPMALVKAVELKAKLFGLLIEKTEHEIKGGFQIVVEGVRREPVEAVVEAEQVEKLAPPQREGDYDSGGSSEENSTTDPLEEFGL